MWSSPNQTFCPSDAQAEGIWSQQAPALLIVFNSSSYSSGAEGSITDTHVHYFLFDLISDEAEIGYDSNEEQCQRGKEGIVEMHEEK